MTVWPNRQGHQVSRKRVQRLIRTMAPTAIYRRTRTSRSAPGHKDYPYLLESKEVNRPNWLGTADSTCLSMARAFLYLVAIMDPDTIGTGA